MKKSSSLAALGAFAFYAAVSTSANAALLFGFNAFGDTSAPELATDGILSATSQVVKTDSSSSTNGSNDGFYGNSPSPTVGTGNGHLRLSDSGPLIFTVTNNLPIAYSLTALYFDFTRLEPPSEPAEDLNSYLTVDADSGSGPNFIDYALILNSQTLASANGDYTDASFFFVDYQPFTLGAGETISFWFASSFADILIDNVSLTGSAIVTGVPEVANFAALGGLLVSGLTIRSRRRTSAKA